MKVALNKALSNFGTLWHPLARPSLGTEPKHTGDGPLFLSPSPQDVMCRAGAVTKMAGGQTLDSRPENLCHSSPEFKT